MELDDIMNDLGVYFSVSPKSINTWKDINTDFWEDVLILSNNKTPKWFVTLAK